MVIPGGTRGVLMRINRVLFSGALAWVLRRLRFRSPLLWTYNPLTGRYLNLRQPGATSKSPMFEQKNGLLGLYISLCNLFD